jgi:transposase
MRSRIECGMSTLPNSAFTLTTFRVDDLPLLVSVIRAMHLDVILDDSVPTHGNTLRQNALTNGEALCLWIVYLLCAGTHRKWKVEEWVALHTVLLTRLWGAPVPASDFTDDRLTTLLSYLARAPVQEAIDRLLCQCTLSLYELQATHIRLDATVLTGYHQVTADGIMQYGHAKGGPEGRTQCKLMAAATPAGQYLTGQYHPGQRADDPLYVPLLTRLFRWALPAGMLVVGDSKMGALATRRHIIAHQHHYYMPLSEAAVTDADKARWIAEAAQGSLDHFTAFTPIFRDEELLGYGFEFTRTYTVVAGEAAVWTERVQIIRSLNLAGAGHRALDRRLEKARTALFALTPAPKQRVTQYTEEGSLREAITAILCRHQVHDVLSVSFQWDRSYQTPKAPAGRLVITAVTVDPVQYQTRRHQCGWRIYVTSAPRERLGLDAGQLLYREGAGQGIERMNRLLKDHDTLGLDRLYVVKSQQIVGISYFVTLAQRVGQYIETTIRHGLVEAGEELPEYSPGQKSSAHPTTKTMLERIAAQGVTLTEIHLADGRRLKHLTELPVILVAMLKHLHLPADLYDCLLE